MESSGFVFICLIGLFVFGLLSFGIFLVLRRPAQNNPVPQAGPLPYDQPSSPQVIYVQQAPKPRGLLSRPADWIALIFLIAVAGCVVNSIVNGGSLPISSHKITYIIRGSSPSASVTLTNASGGTEQHNVNLPASVTYNMGYGSIVTVLAQKSGEGGDIICEIFDGDNLMVELDLDRAVWNSDLQRNGGG